MKGQIPNILNFLSAGRIKYEIGLIQTRQVKTSFKIMSIPFQKPLVY